jgi:hypothetical protein
MLLASDVLTLESGAIQPSLNTLSRFQVLLPLTLVGATISMQIRTFAVRSVVQPLPFVYVAVQLYETARTSGSIVLELALVCANAYSLDLAVAVANCAIPLASVESAVLDRCARTLL